MAPCQHNMRKLALILSFVACADGTEPATPDSSIWSFPDTKTGQVIITPDATDPKWPTDPVTIDAVRIEGDSLVLNVAFGGGCRPHTFFLLGDAVWMESYPVQTGLRLAHEDNNDNCKALVSRVLRFDLSPLKDTYRDSYQASTGIIRLRIQGSTASPTYKW